MLSQFSSTALALVVCMASAPALAQDAFCAVLGCLAEEVLVADPETGSDWHTA